MKLKQHTNDAKKDFAIGDSVVKKDRERLFKLAPKHLGPFGITQPMETKQYTNTGKGEFIRVQLYKYKIYQY